MHFSLQSCQRVDPPHQAAGPTRLIPVESGRMWVDTEYLSLLAQAGLSSFESVMATGSGRVLRTLRDRENRRLELDDGRGLRGMYLKKHFIRSWRHWLRARLGLGPGETPGRIEAINVERLEQAGIAAMRLAAYGQRLRVDGVAESFVLTEELAGYVQLDHFLRKQFPELAPLIARRRDRRLDRLIAAAADVAGRFHQHGFNHRDLYCCHFFILEPSRGRFLVNLIDLQRVERRHWFRRRWVVKDLAQLAYSAPRERVTRTHRLAFIKHYLGIRKLRREDKRLIRQVLAKQRSMERRLGVHP
ncbi:MAG TPA: lipopolysaccharide kinase InaA family protein [Pirellulales bacterium]|nr:lipopolysaccharide kinase InaA family protein [Pirellulales bacterium]